MAGSMIGPLVLLAALISSPGEPARAAPDNSPGFRPSAGASARATATVRILSAAKFGPANLSGASGADRRTAELVDSSGVVRPAELLEFQ